MKIPEEIANRVATGTTKDLWEIFVNLEGEYSGFEEDYQKVKYGIKVKFPIYWIWKENEKIIPKNKEGKIYIDGIPIEEDEFESEKEERKKKMRENILNNTEIKSTIKPRGKE